MHFDIIKFKIFLGDAPLTTHKIHILINFDPKKDLKFGILSTLIVEFFTQSTPKWMYTYKSKLLKGLKLCILPNQIQIFLHKGALPWAPVGLSPWTPSGAL